MTLKMCIMDKARVKGSPSLGDYLYSYLKNLVVRNVSDLWFWIFWIPVASFAALLYIKN